MATDISKTNISISAFSAAEGVSKHSMVKIFTENFEEPKIPNKILVARKKIVKGYVQIIIIMLCVI